MQRVVSFYEKLPRGAAPEIKPKGLVGRYQAKYFGKNASAMRTLYPQCNDARASLGVWRIGFDIRQHLFTPSPVSSSSVTPRTTTSTCVGSPLYPPSCKTLTSLRSPQEQRPLNYEFPGVVIAAVCAR
jgi:hypothetical protein